MTKKTEYQLTFSYDLNQTGKVKYDTYLINSIQKIGGSLTNKYEDEYGYKDLSLSVNSDLSTLQGVVKQVLTDLGLKDVKLSVTAQKIKHVISIDSQQFSDVPSFQALVSSWAFEKSGNFENQGTSFNVILPSKELKEDFLNNVLPQAACFTKGNQAPVSFCDILPEPVINTDNYNSKKRPSASF